MTSSLGRDRMLGLLGLEMGPAEWDDLCFWRLYAGYWFQVTTCYNQQEALRSVGWSGPCSCGGFIRSFKNEWTWFSDLYTVNVGGDIILNLIAADKTSCVEIKPEG
jgi:hypothetical protein